MPILVCPSGKRGQSQAKPKQCLSDSSDMLDYLHARGDAHLYPAGKEAEIRALQKEFGERLRE